jgi:alkanesulfonate monooxygenase SsuD/methylene tetrahydromethanopterin reductase-like flavin-dependent oxidoreductase (luciferase family)
VLEHDWKAFADHLEPGDDPEAVRRTQRKVYRGVVGADRSVEEGSENWLTGTVEDVAATLAEYERQGFDEAILHPMVRTPDDLERQLRLYRDLLYPEFS